ncbi:MAG: Rnase Y domain-containing protein, partial [Gemmatimonas sp.]
MGELSLAALISAVGVVVAGVAFFVGRQSGRAIELSAQQRAKATAEETAARVVDEARREAETIRKGAVVAGKEELLLLRETHEQELRGRRADVEREEKRVTERETQIDRARVSLEAREQELQRRGKELGQRELASTAREQDLERLIGDERRRLEQLAGLSADQAKAELVRRLEEEALADAAS